MKSKLTSWLKNNNNYLEHLAIMNYDGKYKGMYQHYVIIYNVRHFIKWNKIVLINIYFTTHTKLQECCASLVYNTMT